VCSHDGGEKRWRSTTARELSSSPAGLEDEELDQAEASVDPRPTKVMRATTELRGTMPQKGSRADTIAASTTPPTGFLSHTTLCTGPGDPPPSRRRSDAGGGRIPRITGERGGRTELLKNRLSIYCRRREGGQTIKMRFLSVY
jgi:hypothetical protein